MKLIKLSIFRSILLILLVVLVLTGNYYFYSHSTMHLIHKTTVKLEGYHHLLILGAGKKNPVFYSRMNAAIDLYHRLQINRITCSGLVGVVNYNEPYDMRDYLLINNIPDSIIDLDTLGNHTFNSITNYSINHKADSVIIISQEQHLQRALFIAHCKGLSALGFAASDFNGAYNREWFFKEYLSRIKCTVELIF